MKPHIYGLRSPLLDSVVGETNGASIITEDGGRLLRITKISEYVAKVGCVLTNKEEGGVHCRGDDGW